MPTPRFAISMRPELTALSKPVESIPFVGKSWPHFAEIRRALDERLGAYPALPLRIAALDTFASVHAATYLEQIQLMAADTPPDVLPRLSAECTGMEHCLPGYKASLGGMLEAIDQMRAGALDRAYCFSLGGHHAYPDWGHGYCLLNPLAATVRYAQALGFAHVVMVDWDIHHGDGTQAIFECDPDLMYASTHQWPLYPGTGARAERGCGNVLNVPLPPMAGSREFRAALREEILPAIAAFAPDLVMISAGFDAHEADPLASLRLTEADFAWATAELAALAGRHCGGRLVSALEGGYDLEALAACAAAHVRALMAAAAAP